MTNVSEFNAAVLAAAERLKYLARQAEEAAAVARRQQDYLTAEELDRRAVALGCAALVAETRGMRP